MPDRPKLGHVVSYQPPTGWAEEGVLWQAVITRIHKGDSVGLVAFPPDGSAIRILSARYGHGPGDWCRTNDEEEPCGHE